MEMTFMNTYKQLKQPLSMWIINCCLMALLFLVPDDSSIFVYIVIDLAIVANGFDLLKSYLVCQSLQTGTTTIGIVMNQNKPTN